MKIEERIALWRGEGPGEEKEGFIELLCDAEEELIKLRSEVYRLSNSDDVIGQKIGFEDVATIKVDVTLNGTTFTLMEHNFVNEYEVSLDSKNKKIRLDIGLAQIEAVSPITWKFHP